MSDIGTYVSNEVAEQECLTIDKLKEAMSKIPEDPVAKAMREQGFDPDDGCKLILPASRRANFGNYVPSYVQFSNLVEGAYLVRVPQLTSKGV